MDVLSQYFQTGVLEVGGSGDMPSERIGEWGAWLRRHVLCLSATKAPAERDGIDKQLIDGVHQAAEKDRQMRTDTHE